MTLHACSANRIRAAYRAVTFVPHSLTQSVTRLRHCAQPAALQFARLTGTAVFAYLLASVIPETSHRPVLAPLTALLVAQASMYHTVRSALHRVASVFVGVLLAVGFAALLGFSWWSLGVTIAVGLVAGKTMRLGDHALEVPISGILILASATWPAASGRVLDTVIGAAAGLVAGLILAPVRVRPAERDIDKLSHRMADLLSDMASGLAAGAIGERTSDWLGRARDLGGAVVKVDRALGEAEDSVRLNPRGVRLTHAGVALRTGLETLEHVALAIRSLARTICDGATLDSQVGLVDDDGTRESLAAVLQELSASIRTFGQLVPADIAARPEPVESRLRKQLAAASEQQDTLAERVRAEAAAGEAGWELHGAVLVHLDRLRAELQVERRAIEINRGPRRVPRPAWYRPQNGPRHGVQDRAHTGPAGGRPLPRPGSGRTQWQPSTAQRIRRRS